MHKISNAIKCENCRHILESPVFLPCGHSICKKHSTGVKETVICNTCEIEHELPKNGSFPLNLGLAKIIDSQIGSLDLGKEHKEAKKTCKKLEDLLKKFEDTLNDPYNFTHEAIEYLKSVVQLKGEEMKMEIDEKMNRCIKKLDDYKINCKSSFKAKEYLKESERFRQVKNSCRKQLNEWLDILDEIKVNEPEWKRIKRESEKKIEKIQKELSRFIVELLLQKRYGSFRVEIEKNFGKFDIDPMFNLEYVIKNFFHFH
jgi:hypothetical protein